LPLPPVEFAAAMHGGTREDAAVGSVAIRAG
jgi:hypothetical protein